MPFIIRGVHTAEVFDLAPYKQDIPHADPKLRRNVTISELDAKLKVLRTLGFHPTGIFAMAAGMGLPSLNKQQLLDSHADPATDYFPLIYHLEEDNHPNTMEGGDLIFREGTSYNGGELYAMCEEPGAGIGTLKNLILWHWPGARGGEGTGQLRTDAAEPQARVVDISSAANAAFLNFCARDSGLQDRASQILTGHASVKPIALPFAPPAGFTQRADGELSPDGKFRWDAQRGNWFPVPPAD